MNGEVFCFDAVAPVRERGLKSSRLVYDKWVNCRSRKGAWIEIVLRRWRSYGRMGRSRKGAWIEMFHIVQ